MKKEKYILDEAVDSLFKYAKIQAIVNGPELRKDASIELANKRFAVEIKTSITKGNKGIILARLKEIARENNLPVLLVTEYVPEEIAKEFAAEGINYLDIAGNCHIRENKLLIHISGKRYARRSRVNQPRAFQEAGIKLIFQFLVDPEKTKLPYRDLAELSNISLGSVGMIMQELADLNFILRTKQTKKLKNTRELINRWITAYHDVLRPRLMKKQMRFTNKESFNKWKEISLEQNDGPAFWGGEPAANLITGYLHPGIFTIYTNRSWLSFREIGLVPDENGKVEVLEMFWKTETYQGVPPILVYADLMNSSSDRNIETANMILKNELQYLQ
jgi:hypothetical protein